MKDFKFGIRIGAKDDTKKSITSALSGFRSLTRSIAKPITIPIAIGRRGLNAARGSLAFLRDFNLGVGGLARGAALAAGKLDELLDDALKFEPQLRSFESLTGRSGRSAIDMAKSLVAASNGTLTLADAIKIANRGLASGLGFDQIGTVLDFVSKKAVTTGKNAGQAVDTVVTGLARGSTLFLDDFGILVDGLEGVKRTYDAINGPGAFDALGPAAQKAETVRQAMVEMRQQLGAIGVSGKESFFVFEGIKNSLRSSVQRMLAMVARSDALKTGLESVQSLVQGITSHFENGGTFSELLFGKGNGGGLLGLGGAVMIDLGKFIAKGFMGVVLKSFARFFQTLPKVLRFIKDEIVPEIKTALIETATEIGNKLVGLLPASFRSAWGLGASKIAGVKSANDVADVAGTGWLGLKSVIDSVFNTDLVGVKGQQISMGSAVAPALSPQGMMGQLAAATAIARVMTAAEEKAFTRALNRGEVTIKRLPKSTYGGQLFDRAMASVSSFIEPWVDAYDATNPLAADKPQAPKTDDARGLLGRIADSVLGAFDSFGKMDFLADMNAAADSLLTSAVGFQKTQDALSGFLKDFPGKPVEPAGADKPKQQQNKVSDQDIPLTMAARRRQQRQMRMLDHDIRMIQQGNLGARQEARERANQRIKMLRESGRDVRPSDRRRIHAEEFSKVVAERTAALRQQRDAIAKGLDRDARLRDPDVVRARRERIRRESRGDIDAEGNITQIGVLTERKKIVDGIQEQIEFLKRFSNTAAVIVAALDNVSSELSGATRRLRAARR